MKKPSPDPEGVGKLRALQRDFGGAVTRPLDSQQGMQRVWMDGKPALTMASAFIKPNDRLDSFERLEIYNRQYWFRLIDSLYEDFPALRHVLGEERFRQLILAYLTTYKSRSFTLRDLGDRMEIFVKTHAELVTTHEALVRDIVRLEWAHIVAFDGAALPPLSVDDLLDSDPSTLRVTLQPHLTFLACDHAVDDFVLAIRKQEFTTAETSNAVSEEPRPARAISKAPLPKPEKIWIAVHRVANGVYYKRLDREAFRICTALQKGASLQAACEKALVRNAANEAFAATLQSWFTQWSSFGWFCPRPTRP